MSRVPSRHFACLLLWDATGETVETVSRLAELLVDAGCVFGLKIGRGPSGLSKEIDQDIRADDDTRPDASIR